MSRLLELGITAAERGLLPDALVRAGIRRLCRHRREELRSDSPRATAANVAAFRQTMRHGPIAPLADAANQQHYELPPEFFALMLGPLRKYSCCFFPTADASLATAEEAALAITCRRAELADGQDVLELGCGWGALCLWLAEQYPHSRITAVSNSTRQQRFIAAEAADRGLGNLRIVKADMNDFAAEAQAFDRVVSVEMFEHMRNYQELLNRIASWLRPAGKLFVHHFCHRNTCYPFETEGVNNWMGHYFFTGGIMPRAGLLSEFDQALGLVRQEHWSGLHYQKTAGAWLANLDANRVAAQRILACVYGTRQARPWFQRWRMFLMAVAELFGSTGGDEWFVTHCLLERVASHSGQLVTR